MRAAVRVEHVLVMHFILTTHSAMIRRQEDADGLRAVLSCVVLSYLPMANSGR